MYAILLIFAALILQLLPPVVTVSSPASMTREEGEDAVFMFNTSTSILEVAWGIRDGETDNHKIVLITVDKRFGAYLTSNAGYRGRVSFVGNLTKSQAWFKIANLNINDTNHYMAKIRVYGTSFYKIIHAQLTVTKPPVPISSPGSLTREVGQDVVFMVNSTAMSEATWGVRDGDTNYLNPRLYRVFNPGGAFPDTNINSTSYAGRVSFVGDLSKGQAWFKIKNLNINDTNQYMALITLQGETGYRYIPTKLNVIQPVTTEPLKTSTIELTTGVSSSQTYPRPTTSQVPQLSNRSMSINVVKDVVGDFSDSNSAAFKQFSENFVCEINSVYKNIHTFEKAKVTSLSENIIPVKFVVYFKSTIKPDEICGPLKDAVKDNRLGSLKIVPGSLGCSNDPKTSFPKKQSNSASTCTSIIVACVTVNIFLILVVLFLLIYIWRLRLNTDKRARRRNSSSIQDKNPEAYENVHPMEDTSQDITTKTAQTPNAEKELYETINETRDKDSSAIATTVKHTRGPSAGVQGDAPSFPQHYQELQRKAPNPTPLYEPLKQQGFRNKEELASEGPKTYEQLQQSASGREYQSLKSYKDAESKV